MAEDINPSIIMCWERGINNCPTVKVKGRSRCVHRCSSMKLFVLEEDLTWAWCCLQLHRWDQSIALMRPTDHDSFSKKSCCFYWTVLESRQFAYLLQIHWTISPARRDTFVHVQKSIRINLILSRKLLWKMHLLLCCICKIRLLFISDPQPLAYDSSFWSTELLMIWWSKMPGTKPRGTRKTWFLFPGPLLYNIDPCSSSLNLV